jgi:hypothetical protein
LFLSGRKTTDSILCPSSTRTHFSFFLKECEFL